MTTEEKARAYDEALTTAKRIISENCSEIEKLCLKCVFSELKDEDERMVVKIARTLSFAAAHNLITDYDELLAMQNWLEKQKDLDKMIVVSPEVWDKAIADAFENGKKEGEKQKEPHYTKRNALFDKCVENCDPEVMKRVSDEVDEMLEKEQKPADDKAFEEWVDDWWKHNKVNNPDSYDKGDEIQFDELGFKNFCRGIRNMYQQEPAWSEENEKIRKAIIEHFKQSETEFPGLTFGGYYYADILAWLERQGNLMKALQTSNAQIGQLVEENYKLKKQKPYEPKNWPADKDSLTQEQKPVKYGDDVVEEAEEYTSKVDCGEYGVEVTEAYIAGVLSERNRGTEWSAKGRRGRMGGIPEYVRRKAEAFKDKMEPPYDANDICTAYEAGALESAKPAELEQLAKLREMTHEIRDAYERGIEVGRVESKQEWSEEDEKMLRTIISDGSRGVELDSKQISWLKSLRPQSKKELSIEKAIQWLDDTFYFLNNSSGRGRDCEITTHDFDSLEEMYDSFRKAVTVDSEPSWKPSEEQMESLAYAIQVLNSNPHPKSAKAYQDLQTLYKNIKYGN